MAKFTISCLFLVQLFDYGVLKLFELELFSEQPTVFALLFLEKVFNLFVGLLFLNFLKQLRLIVIGLDFLDGTGIDQEPVINIFDCEFDFVECLKVELEEFLLFRGGVDVE